MKFIIAPDSFKGSLSAAEIAKTIAQTLKVHFPNAECILAPMADGGEGTLDCLMSGKGGKIEKAMVSDPLGRTISASFGILENDTAIIETAQASGLTLLKEQERNPLITSTLGTGELILKALDSGARQFIIGLGGSATCDGGMGALAALGVQFKNISLNTLPPCGQSLAQIHEINTKGLDPRLKECEFILAHDVDNALLGLNGALMYAPQKGAKPADIEQLHKGYEQWAYLLQQTSGKKISDIPGSGAAGGLGAGLYSFLNARFEPGAAFMMKQIDLDSHLKEASVVFTGEGQIDPQTLHGKTPIAVAKLAKAHQLPVIAVTGSLKEGFEAVYSLGIDAVFCLPNAPMTKKECLRSAKPLLINLINNIAHLLKLRILL